MEKPRRHRFVQLEDLVVYQERMRAERRAALEQMLADAEDDDMYDRTDRPAPRDAVSKVDQLPGFESRLCLFAW